MEKELKDFFITVVNYSLFKNIETYLESLKNLTIRKPPRVPKGFDEYMENHKNNFKRDLPIPEFIQEYIDSLYSYSGMLCHGRYALDLYLFLLRCQKGEVDFTDEELTSFEQNRKKLIRILDHAINGQYIGEVTTLEEYKKIIAAANTLQPSRQFVMCKGAGIQLQDAEFRLWGNQWNNAPNFIDYHYPAVPPSIPSDVASLYLAQGIRVLNGILNLASYCLCLALADNQHLKIKRCPYCELFFTAKDTKRKICYENQCERAYHRKDMQSRRENEPENYC